MKSLKECSSFYFAGWIVFLLLGLFVVRPVSADAPVSFAGLSTCIPDRIATPTTLLPYLGQDHSQFPVKLEADQIDSRMPGSLVLDGDAYVVQGAQAVFADHMLFSREDRSVEASGNVVIHSSRGDRITADLLQLDLVTRIGQAENIRFQKAVLETSRPNCANEECQIDTREDQATRPVVQAGRRGQAKRIYFDGHDRERLENVELSSCVEGNDSVVLAASEIILDHGTGEATAQDLRVRFFGIPIVYFPTITFPITDDRKTGFLFPIVGFGGDNGTRLVVPFYWNIAPEHDATITTDYLSNRGMLLRGEYRYIGETRVGDFGGQARAEIIPDDRKFGGERYGLSLLHDQKFGAYWSGRIDLGYVSDSDYLDDFGDSLDAQSADYVPQRAELEYNRSGWLLGGDDFNFGLRFSDFQIIDPEISEEDEPYAKLPEITVGWQSRTEGSLLEPHFGASWTRFDHPTPSSTQGDRLTVRPGLGMDLKEEYGYVRPQLELDIISYNLVRRLDEGILNPGSAVPVFSIDSGLFLEREILWGGQDHIQTLEPRLFYAFVPFVNQNDQPIFDDGEFELNSPSKYFMPNRFHRTDRVGDTNRISIGLESRVVDAVVGKQRLKTGLAQMFYLSDRKVRENSDAPPLTESYSDLFGEVDINLSDELSTSVEVVWNWKEHKILSSDLHLDYRDHRSQFGLSYGYEPGESREELVADLIWPLAPHWLVGATNIYSLEESENLHTGISLGYDACCWAVQLQLEENTEEENGNQVGSNTEVMFTLRLKDLGGISSSTVEGIITGFGLD